jgi:hypothetical protein
MHILKRAALILAWGVQISAFSVPRAVSRVPAVSYAVRGNGADYRGNRAGNGYYEDRNYERYDRQGYYDRGNEGVARRGGDAANRGTASWSETARPPRNDMRETYGQSAVLNNVDSPIYTSPVTPYTSPYRNNYAKDYGYTQGSRNLRRTASREADLYDYKGQPENERLSDGYLERSHRQGPRELRSSRTGPRDNLYDGPYTRMRSDYDPYRNTQTSTTRRDGYVSAAQRSEDNYVPSSRTTGDQTWSGAVSNGRQSSPNYGDGYWDRPETQRAYSRGTKNTYGQSAVLNEVDSPVYTSSVTTSSASSRSIDNQRRSDEYRYQPETEQPYARGMNDVDSYSSGPTYRPVFRNGQRVPSTRSNRYDNGYSLYVDDDYFEEPYYQNGRGSSYDSSDPTYRQSYRQERPGAHRNSLPWTRDRNGAYEDRYRPYDHRNGAYDYGRFGKSYVRASDLITSGQSSDDYIRAPTKYTRAAQERSDDFYVPSRYTRRTTPVQRSGQRFGSFFGSSTGNGRRTTPVQREGQKSGSFFGSRSAQRTQNSQLGAFSVVDRVQPVSYSGNGVINNRQPYRDFGTATGRNGQFTTPGQRSGIDTLQQASRQTAQRNARNRSQQSRRRSPNFNFTGLPSRKTQYSTTRDSGRRTGNLTARNMLQYSTPRAFSTTSRVNRAGGNRQKAGIFNWNSQPFARGAGRQRASSSTAKRRFFNGRRTSGAPLLNAVDVPFNTRSIASNVKFVPTAPSVARRMQRFTPQTLSRIPKSSSRLRRVRPAYGSAMALDRYEMPDWMSVILAVLLVFGVASMLFPERAAMTLAQASAGHPVVAMPGAALNLLAANQVSDLVDWKF